MKNVIKFVRVFKKKIKFRALLNRSVFFVDIIILNFFLEQLIVGWTRFYLEMMIKMKIHLPHRTRASDPSFETHPPIEPSALLFADLNLNVTKKVEGRKSRLPSKTIH